MIPQTTTTTTMSTGAGALFGGSSGRSPASTGLKPATNNNNNSNNNNSNNRRVSSDIPEIRIAVLGTLGVGKSALVVKYITKRFIMEYDPLLEDVYSKSESLEGRDVIIKLMDTSDSEEKSADRYLKWANAFVVVFSITCRVSFDVAAAYLETIARYQQESGKEFPVTLVGNKSDLERYRTVSKTKAEELASQFDCLYQETSAAEDLDSVVVVFRDTARDVLRSRDLQVSMQSLFISEDRSPMTAGGHFNLPPGPGTIGASSHSPVGGNKRPGNSSAAKTAAKDSDKKDDAKLPHHRRPAASFRIFNKSFKIFN